MKKFIVWTTFFSLWSACLTGTIFAQPLNKSALAKPFVIEGKIISRGKGLCKVYVNAYGQDGKYAGGTATGIDGKYALQARASVYKIVAKLWLRDPKLKTRDPSVRNLWTDKNEAKYGLKQEKEVKIDHDAVVNFDFSSDGVFVVEGKIYLGNHVPDSITVMAFFEENPGDTKSSCIFKGHYQIPAIEPILSLEARGIHWWNNPVTKKGPWKKHSRVNFDFGKEEDFFIIQGHLTDKLGKPLKHAAVRGQGVNPKALAGYAQTDDRGKYKMVVRETIKEFEIETWEHKKFRKVGPWSKSSTVDFSLKDTEVKHDERDELKRRLFEQKRKSAEGQN